RSAHRAAHGGRPRGGVGRDPARRPRADLGARHHRAGGRANGARGGRRRDDPGRLATLAALGFTDTIDVAATSLEQRLGAGRRFDVVFEAVGLASTLTQGLSFTRYDGVLVVVGIHPAPVTIDVTALVRQQQQIRGSHRADPGTWARVLALLARDGERIRPMITHRLPLEAALEGFELARRKIASKVVGLPGV